MKPIRTEQDLDELHRATVANAVIGACAANGVFAALADGKPHNVSELPGDVRALQIMLSVLAHLGLVSGDGQTVALSAGARSLWESGVLRGKSAEQSLGILAQLDRMLLDGAPARATDVGVRDDNPDEARGFMEFLYRRSADSALEVARWLSPRLKPGAHVLDLGGGHGRYAQALVERGLKATVFDKPLITKLARERYGDALGYRDGDFMKDSLGGPYDAALLSNIIHGLGPAANEALLARVRESLAPGGLAVIKDMFLDESGAHPKHAVFFGVTMLTFTREGRSYSHAEFRAQLAAAGFTDIEHVFVADGVYSLVFARRPNS